MVVMKESPPNRPNVQSKAQKAPSAPTTDGHERAKDFLLLSDPRHTAHYSRITGRRFEGLAFSNPIALGALFVIGKFGWPELYVSALLLPGLAVGYLVSSWLSQLASARVIRTCLLSITAISGVVLVFKG
jgi:hypothetical protein